MSIFGWVVMGLIVLIILYAIAVYNRLVRLRALVKEGFSGITVQLRRRADLVPNLVETVEGYATHERETLDAGHRPPRRCDRRPTASQATAQADAPVDRPARPADGRRRGLSRPQGRREFPPAVRTS